MRRPSLAPCFRFRLLGAALALGLMAQPALATVRGREGARTVRPVPPVPAPHRWSDCPERPSRQRSAPTRLLRRSPMRATTR